MYSVSTIYNSFEGLGNFRHVSIKVPLYVGIRLHLQDTHGLLEPIKVLLENLLRLKDVV